MSRLKLSLLKVRLCIIKIMSRVFTSTSVEVMVEVEKKRPAHHQSHHNSSSGDHEPACQMKLNSWGRLDGRSRKNTAPFTCLEQNHCSRQIKIKPKESHLWSTSSSSFVQPLCAERSLWGRRLNTSSTKPVPPVTESESLFNKENTFRYKMLKSHKDPPHCGFKKRDEEACSAPRSSDLYRNAFLRRRSVRDEKWRHVSDRCLPCETLI